MTKPIIPRILCLTKGVPNQIIGKFCQVGVSSWASTHLILQQPFQQWSTPSLNSIVKITWFNQSTFRPIQYVEVKLFRWVLVLNHTLYHWSPQVGICFKAPLSKHSRLPIRIASLRALEKFIIQFNQVRRLLYFYFFQATRNVFSCLPWCENAFCPRENRPLS